MSARDDASMRPALRGVLDKLLASSEDARQVSLDDLGAAIGTLAVTPADIDDLMARLEAEGRRIVGPEGGRGERALARVLDSARALKRELGRSPKLDELAAHAELSVEEVRHALALARVMQR